LVVPPGPYTVRMTLDNKTYAQNVTVRRDPRSRASVAESWRRYRFAIPIVKLNGDVNAALAAAACVESTYPNRYGAIIDPVAGIPKSDPDNPYGSPPTNFTTLYYFGNGRNGTLPLLIGAVQRTDGAPTPEQRGAWRTMGSGARAALARWAVVARGLPACP
jgi:hypothetical protein